ncbi:acetyl-CoA carboxylase, biotin carboxyl carrier protein [Pseudomonas sp. PA15(2017)]|uniref:acetyl-CoA carboxylase biotin carboxyl carrier protein n=1 Tax=Pseudomonas sp. PA15(2017) TaxID=1932111 RepID=UPI000960A53A|nr:acetyl-CoA carboxylase biotin carboxyl carrier protein [Pseudomonas sp. PA15(2017)]OLU26244.1 acetyl-CoA carboxylase, biotin carboxyl carrier protein [Pseudomonas sp. PA15(2017)]
MDIQRIEKLAELVERTGLDELEVREGDFHLRLSNKGQSRVAGKAQRSAEQVPADSRANKASSAGHDICAPMVGIFYRSESPEAPSLVEVGQAVSKGDLLCIIEAMKMMNHVEAEVSGTIASILVENGQPVEYDQPLFTIV